MPPDMRVTEISVTSTTMASETIEWPVIPRTSIITSDRVLIDIPDDEFDKCTGTPKTATEHASAIASSEILFPDSTYTGLSVKHKTQDGIRRLSLRPPRFAEENIAQNFIRVIVVRGQERLLGWTSRGLIPLMMLGPRSLRRWVFQRICKICTMHTCHCKTANCCRTGVGCGSTLWHRYGYGYGQ